MSSRAPSRDDARKALRHAIFKALPRLRSVMPLPYRNEAGETPVIAALGEDTVGEVFEQAFSVGGANVFVHSEKSDGSAELDLLVVDLSKTCAVAAVPEDVGREAPMCMLVERLKQEPNKVVSMRVTKGLPYGEARNAQKLSDSLLNV